MRHWMLAVGVAAALGAGCGGHGHHAHGGGEDGASGGHHHRFTDPEALSQRWDDPTRDEWQKPAEVIALMGLGPGMTVADLGAGTGYFMPHLAAAVGPEGQVHALDVEDEMVGWLQSRAQREGLTQVQARKVPFDDPQLPEGAVDAVITVNTWHHIEGREAYTRRLAAALKPGGAVYVVDYTQEFEGPGPPPAMRLAPEQVIKELTAGGLEAALIEETLPRQYIVVGRKPAAPAEAPADAVPGAEPTEMPADGAPADAP